MCRTLLGGATGWQGHSGFEPRIALQTNGLLLRMRVRAFWTRHRTGPRDGPLPPRDAATSGVATDATEAPPLGTALGGQHEPVAGTTDRRDTACGSRR